MDDQNKNLILATGLSFLVILVWFFLFPPPEPVETANTPAVQTTADGTVAAIPEAAGTVTPEAAAAVPDAPRLAIDTPRLSGSISMLGGRIDDLSLKTYHATVDPASPTVKLFKPVGEAGAYYALFGCGTSWMSPLSAGKKCWAVKAGTAC